jgi:hypothetical protein
MTLFWSAEVLLEADVTEEEIVPTVVIIGRWIVRVGEVPILRSSRQDVALKIRMLQVSPGVDDVEMSIDEVPGF